MNHLILIEITKEGLIMVFEDYIEDNPRSIDHYREEYDDTYDCMLDPTAYSNTDEDLIVYAYYNPEDLDHDIYFNQFRYILKEVSEGYSPIKTMKSLHSARINPIKAALSSFRYENKNVLNKARGDRLHVSRYSWES